MRFTEGEYDVAIGELQAVETRLLDTDFAPEMIRAALFVAAGKTPVGIHLADFHTEINGRVLGLELGSLEVGLIVGGIFRVLLVPTAQSSREGALQAETGDEFLEADRECLPQVLVDFKI